MTTNSSSTTKKISTFMFTIIFLVIALSLISLGIAANAFIAGDAVAGAYMLGISIIAMVLATYVLLQSRRRMVAMKLETPQIMTTIECKKCAQKNTREFQRGDYVFKELDKCQKCDDKQMITAIYKEVKEKEKASPF